MRKKAVQADGPKMLSEADLLKIHANDLENKNAKLELIIEQKNLELVITKQKLMSQDVTLMQARIKTLGDIQANILSKKRDFVKGLTKKYNLAEGWGFDPDSGEIKEGQL